MIVVNCSQCRAQLEMDDAFAGGVCRCHFCGTIQTVPAAAKRQTGKPSPAAQAPATKAPAGKSGNGLDALAAAAAAAARGATESKLPPPAPPIDYARPPQLKKLGMPMVAALAVIVLLLATLGWLLMVRPTAIPSATVVPGGGRSGQGGGAAGPSDGEATIPAAPVFPNFCGIDLDGVPGIVYLLDRGAATGDLFDALKEATYASIASLKPGQKFQIIFWDNGGELAAYPADGLADASPQEIDSARQQFADLVAYGRSSADRPLRRAVQGRPGAIVLVTAKAFEVDQGMVKQVQSAVKGTTIKVHTVALKHDDGNPFLKDIAEKTHGEYRVVTARELEEASQ